MTVYDPRDLDADGYLRGSREPREPEPELDDWVDPNEPHPAQDAYDRMFYG